jgi:ribosomal protein L37AE/L43A
MVTRKETKTVTVEKDVTYCDVCGDKILRLCPDSVKHCSICGVDLCGKCDVSTEEDHDSYRHFCPGCASRV